MCYSFHKNKKRRKKIIPFIKTNFDLCTGCRICQMACAMSKTSGFNPRRSRLIIKDKAENLYHKPIVCSQCKNAYCMNVCPAKAITRNKQGIVIIDGDKCIGCGLCVQFCPENLVSLDPDTGKAVKCDMCSGDPECVKACPTGALELIEQGETNE